MTRWRYIAQRVVTNEFLDWEVPIDVTELGWDLSGPGSLRGTVSPDTGALRAEDGRLVLEEWGTFLFAEADGVIRWGGIVVSSKFDGPAWQVEAAGFTSYPHGIPFAGEYRAVEQDPAHLVRLLWQHLQGYPDANLGVTVEGSTPVRLGTGSDGVVASAQALVNARTAAVEALNKTVAASRKALQVAGDAFTAANKALAARRKTLTTARTAVSTTKRNLAAAKKKGDASAVAAAQTAYNNAVSAFNSADTAVKAAILVANTAKAEKASRDQTVKAQVVVQTNAKSVLATAKDALSAAQDQARADGGAYKYLWWETPDVGQEIDALASETPFDYTEEHAWSGDTITHTVRVHHPRAGRRRTDLSFVQGDNVLSVVTPTLDGDNFANEIVGLGAGEGSGSLRRVTALRDGRLRRVAVYSAKDVKKKERLDARIQGELTRHQLALQVDSITVRDHPNAVIGSWQVGDDILIEATIPWRGEVALWHRVTGWSLLGEDKAELRLARSDQFNYGG